MADSIIQQSLPFKINPYEKTGSILECRSCGNSFYAIRYRLKRQKTGNGRTCGPRRFCSKTCADKGLLTNTPLQCAACGNEFYVSRSQQKSRNRQCCSIPCRSIMKRRLAEKRRETYTLGQLNRLARQSPESIAWRKAVFARDDYTCQHCGLRGGTLEADHIKPFAYFPELRYELANGRTLCRKCHDKTKLSAARMKEVWLGIPRKCTPTAGSKWGQWEVLGESSDGRSAYWLCRCKCGTVRNVLSYALRVGDSHSCRLCIPRDALGRMMSRDKWPKAAQATGTAPTFSITDGRRRTTAGTSLTI